MVKTDKPNVNGWMSSTRMRNLKYALLEKGDYEEWSAGSRFVALLTRNYSEKEVYGLASLVQPATIKEQELKLDMLRKFKFNIDRHMEFPGIGIPPVEIEISQQFANAITWPQQYSGSRTLATIDFGSVDISVQLPPVLKYEIGKESGELSINTSEGRIEVVVESLKYDYLRIEASLDGIVIGMNGELLEIADIKDLRGSVFYTVPASYLSIPSVRATPDEFQPISFYSWKYKYADAKQFEKEIKDGRVMTWLEGQIIDYLNNNTLPKYL